jgi:nitroreductase
MRFVELAAKRESCRKYKKMPVEREKLLACVEAARMSPSACNSQPWSFVLADDADLTSKVAETLQEKITGLNSFTDDCGAFVILVEENANLSSKLGGRFKDQEFAQMDIGIAAQSMCLAATDEGLGSCIIGWFHEKALKALLDIPIKKRIRLVIALGYPDSDHPRAKSRKPLETVLHINRW